MCACVKYSCPGRSRSDFLAVGEVSPIRNSEGVGGSAFLERRKNLACVLLVGEKKHRLFHVLCLSVPNEKVLCCAFSESMHSSSRLGFSGASWRGGSTPSAAKTAGTCVGGLLEHGRGLSYIPCVVLLTPFAVTSLF